MHRTVARTRRSTSIGVTIAVAVAVLATEATLAGGNELHAPWSGLGIALGVGMLVAVGFVAGLRGMFVAPAVVAASMVVARLLGDRNIESEGAGTPDACDPSCGFSLGGALLLILPVVIALAGIGAALRRFMRGHGRSRHSAER